MRLARSPLPIVLLRLSISFSLSLALAASALPAAYPNDPLYDRDPLNDVEEQWNLVSDGRGISADKAWALTTGHPTIVIANIDVGVNYAHEDLREQVFVNTGETPRPQDETGRPFPNHDSDGDGAAGIGDWARDPRVADSNGNGVLDLGDLIHAFSDGIDNDGNGFVDDIGGWDFEDGDNDPFDATGNGHGTQTSSIAVARTNNGLGMAGVCPDCRLLPVRISENPEVVRPEKLAQGVLYAADLGAASLSMSIGALANPRFLQEAFRYAESRGVAAAAAAGNEHSFHHNVPANYPEVTATGALQPDNSGPLALPWRASDFLRRANYSDYGGHLWIMAPSWIIAAKWPDTYYDHVGGTSSATPHTAGVAGLVRAIARKAGLDPPPSPREIRQILRASAQDITGTPYDCIPGFDQWTGYGRLDAAAAVERTASGRIPPAVRIDEPGRFAPLDPGRSKHASVTATLSSRRPLARIVLEAAPGVEPAEGDFGTIRELTNNLGTAFSGVVGKWDLSKAWKRTKKESPEAGPNRYAWTLRVRAEDESGEAGEDRRTVFVRNDPDMRKGFPLFVGGSGEASLAAADLDGDRVEEIVVVLSSGEVRVIEPDGTPFALYRGAATLWPYRTGPAPGLDPADPRNHLAAPAYATGGVEPARAPILASPVIADLDRDGEPEIIVATMEGEIVALGPGGAVLPGFPVRARPAEPPAPPLQTGFLSSPVAADLDADGDLEILAGSLDATLYAFHHDGRPVAGWPIVVRDPAGGVQRASIVATPAIGDIDGDGRIEVVVGTGELSGKIPEKAGRLYAFSEDGRIEPGWPVLPTAPIGEILPLVGEGIVANPVLADMDEDGRLEIAVTVVTGMPKVYRGDGSLFSELLTAPLGTASESAEPALITVPGGASLADLDGDGTPEYLTGGIGISFGSARLFEGLKVPFDFLFGAWDVRTGHFLPAFPRVADGFHFFIAAAAADLDGDGRIEAIDGSAHYLLHAYDADGKEPAGWPKSTGGWLVGTPFLSDLDADGRLEILANTREGYVFCWNTKARSDAHAPWPSFQHDTWHTGSLASDTIPPAAVGHVEVKGTNGSVVLRFAGVGDDGMVGRPSRYLVLESPDPIVPANRSSAQPREIEAPAVDPGRPVRIDVPGASSRNHFAVQALDEAGNVSPIASR